MESVLGPLGGWAYPVVGVLAYLETAALVGLLVPGELAVTLAGALTATGRIELAPLIAIVWAAALAGDSTGYVIGRRLGERGLVERAARSRPAAVRRVRGVVDRHGAKAVVAGRFVGVLRAFTPLVAGSAGMPVRRFLVADAIGAGLWAATFCLLGRAFSDSLDAVLGAAQRVQLAAGCGLAVAAAAAALVLWRRRAARTPVEGDGG
jgi:membrane protein DedA with SNARE-associated domain